MSKTKAHRKNYQQEEKEAMKDHMFNPFAAWKHWMEKDNLMHHHKKNLESLSEVTKVAADVMKSIAQLQSQYIKQTFEDMSKMMTEMMSHSHHHPAHHHKGADHFEKHAESVHHHVNRSMDHAHTLASKIAQSQKQVFDIMQARAKEGMEAMHEHHQHHHHHAAGGKAKSTKH